MIDTTYVRVVAALLCACLPAACINNPLFLLDPDDDTTGGMSGASTTTGAPGTSGQPTSTSSADTTHGVSTGPDATTTAGVTTGFTSTTDMDTDEPVSTSTGPGSGGDTSTGDLSSSSSGGDVPGCGDGVMGFGEECDAGVNNNNEGSCTKECKKAKCGDGLTRLEGDAPEMCDDGPGNGGGLGKCSGDCGGIVPPKPYKIVVLSTGVPGTLLDANSMMKGGIAAGDEACQLEFGPTYKVLAVDGVKRRATLSPWQGDDRIDWVLRPYTGYANANDDLLGITGHEALLGIQNEAFMPIPKPISSASRTTCGPACVRTGRRARTASAGRSSSATSRARPGTPGSPPAGSMATAPTAVRSPCGSIASSSEPVALPRHRQRPRGQRHSA